MNIRDRHRLESHARRIEELRLWRKRGEPHRGVALLGWARGREGDQAGRLLARGSAAGELLG